MHSGHSSPGIGIKTREYELDKLVVKVSDKVLVLFLPFPFNIVCTLEYPELHSCSAIKKHDISA